MMKRDNGKLEWRWWVFGIWGFIVGLSPYKFSTELIIVAIGIIILFILQWWINK